jgi:hypothetical protein
VSRTAAVGTPSPPPDGVASREGIELRLEATPSGRDPVRGGGWARAQRVCRPRARIGDAGAALAEAQSELRVIDIVADPGMGKVAPIVRVPPAHGQGLYESTIGEVTLE